VTEEIDEEMAELLADTGPDFEPTEAQVIASNPYLWTPEQRRMAGIPETRKDAGSTLPPHIRQMVHDMGVHNSSTSK
jgi:hypothetical protein